MPYSAELALVKISATEAGTYANVVDVTGFSWTHGREGTTITRVLGNANGYVKAGGKTNTYTIDGLLDLEDANGQNILETAYNNGTDVWVQFLVDPNAAVGDREGWAAQCKVTEYSGSVAADGEQVECSFSLEGTGVTTDIVAAA